MNCMYFWCAISSLDYNSVCYYNRIFRSPSDSVSDVLLPLLFPLGKWVFFSSKFSSGSIFHLTLSLKAFPFPSSVMALTADPLM